MGICQGKNTRIFEPTKITQVKVVQKWLQEEAQKNGWTSDAYKNVWINYQDMDMKHHSFKPEQYSWIQNIWAVFPPSRKCQTNGGQGANHGGINFQGITVQLGEIK